MPIGLGTATAIGAAGAVGGGLIAASGAKSAAKTQAAAANQAAQMQLDMFNTIRSDLAPYRSIGTAAMPGYAALLGLPTGGSGGPTYSYAGGGTTAPSFSDSSAIGGGAFGGGFNPGGLAPQYTGAYGGGSFLNDAQMARLLQDRPDIGAEFNKAMANGSAQQRGLGDLGTYASDWYNRVRPTMGDTYTLPAELMNPTAATGGPAADPQAQIQSFLESTPGYKFTRDQGMQAVESSLGARGLGGLSGSLGKGLARFVSGLADTTYENRLNDYFKAVGVGQSAANQTGTFGQNASSSAGSNIVNAGTASASGTLGATGAIGNSFASAASLPLQAKILGGGMYTPYGGGGGGGIGWDGVPL